jgi:ATP-dependent exoDNAse (exonuclease V) beta subunit
MIQDALKNVERIRGSALWDRVRAAEERLTEVPLAALLAPEARDLAIAKGVIDLVLRFQDGWEIHDYKSDRLGMEQITARYAAQVQTYAALWRRITGQHVRFAGLFSTRTLEMSADLQKAANRA